MKPGLADYQRAFSQALLDSDRAVPREYFASHHDLQNRFSVYRNNVYYSLGTALADLYPVVHRLVGDEFFRATARSWIRENPPDSPAMVNFGGSFCEFLVQFEATRDMPWLADVARLELARHRCYHAVDQQSVAVEQLSGIAPETLLSSRLVIADHVQIVRSRWPIVEIWSSNQQSSGMEPTVDLDRGGDFALVFRDGYEVLLEAVHEDEWRFVAALLSGELLVDALSAAGAVPAEQLLAGAVRRGLIVDVEDAR